jgi:Domain of unknown function (DUF4386)
MTAPKTLARTAGLLWLLVVVGGLFAVPVFASIDAPGDAAATAGNIRASATLFRAGFLSYLLAGPPFLLTAIVLYGLLKHAHELAAVAMVALNAVGTATACLNLLNWYTALTIATGDTYPRTFGTAGADTLTMLYVDMYNNGVSIAFVFDSLWLVPLGYLVIRSGYFPKALGVALIVGCFAYLAGFVFIDFLAPDAAAGIDFLFGAVGGLSELAFVAWLLVKGVRVPASKLPVPA